MENNTTFAKLAGGGNALHSFSSPQRKEHQHAYFKPVVTRQSTGFYVDDPSYTHSLSEDSDEMKADEVMIDIDMGSMDRRRSNLMHPDEVDMWDNDEVLEAEYEMEFEMTRLRQASRVLKEPNVSNKRDPAKQENTKFSGTTESSSILELSEVTIDDDSKRSEELELLTKEDTKEPPCPYWYLQLSKEGKVAMEKAIDNALGPSPELIKKLEKKMGFNETESNEILDWWFAQEKNIIIIEKEKRRRKHQQLLLREETEIQIPDEYFRPFMAFMTIVVLLYIWAWLAFLFGNQGNMLLYLCLWAQTIILALVFVFAAILFYCESCCGRKAYRCCFNIFPLISMPLGMITGVCVLLLYYGMWVYVLLVFSKNPDTLTLSFAIVYTLLLLCAFVCPLGFFMFCRDLLNDNSAKEIGPHGIN